MKIRNELIEKFNKLHIDVVDSYFDEECENYNHPSLFYLAKTIDMMGEEVDAVYFVPGWQLTRGCRIERKICEEYGIMILDENFFPKDTATPKREIIGNNIYGIPKVVTLEQHSNHIPQID